MGRQVRLCHSPVWNHLTASQEEGAAVGAAAGMVKVEPDAAEREAQVSRKGQAMASADHPQRPRGRKVRPAPPTKAELRELGGAYRCR